MPTSNPELERATKRGAWRGGTLLALTVAAVFSLVFAACSNTSTPSSSSSSSTSTSSKTTTSSSATPATLVPQTATGTEFYSPSKNISCEIDYNFGTSSLTQTLCLTLSPPKSVVLKTDGSLTECSGQQCLSNAGENTPTLAYGSVITLGPFTCQSSAAGVKCTLTSGAGFVISSSAITPQGSATVSTGAASG